MTTPDGIVATVGELIVRLAGLPADTPLLVSAYEGGYTTASPAITPVQELSGMPWYYGQYALPAESHIAADLGWQCVDVEPPAPTGPPVTAAVLTRTVRADD